MSPVRFGKLADIPNLPVRVEFEYEANLAQVRFWRLIQRSSKLDGEKFMREMRPTFGKPVPHVVEEDGYYSARMPFTYAQDPVEWFLRETGLDPQWPPVYSEEHAHQVWRGICHQVGLIDKPAEPVEIAARKPWRGVCQEVADFGRDIPSIPLSLLESKDNPGKGPRPHHFNEPSESLEPDEKSLTEGELSWSAKLGDIQAKLGKTLAELPGRLADKVTDIRLHSKYLNDPKVIEEFKNKFFLAFGAGAGFILCAAYVTAFVPIQGMTLISAMGVSYETSAVGTLIGRVYANTTTRELALLAEGMLEAQGASPDPASFYGSLFGSMIGYIEKYLDYDLTPLKY